MHFLTSATVSLCSRSAALNLFGSKDQLGGTFPQTTTMGSGGGPVAYLGGGIPKMWVLKAALGPPALHNTVATHLQGATTAYRVKQSATSLPAQVSPPIAGRLPGF